MPGGPAVWIMDVMWLCMGVLQGERITPSPDVYPGIDAGLENSKKFKFPG